MLPQTTPPPISIATLASAQCRQREFSDRRTTAAVPPRPMNPAEAVKKTPTMVLPAEMSGVSKPNFHTITAQWDSRPATSAHCHTAATRQIAATATHGQVMS